MRKLATVFALLVAAAGAYDYFSPHIALGGVKTAIQEGDAAALEERVDFPHLRENLKSQFNAVMLKETSSKLEDNPFGALALGLVSKLVDGMVDAFVTPEGLARLSRGDRPQPGSSRPDRASHTSSSSEELFAEARLTRDSLNRFSVWVPNEEVTETQFVFRRYGLRWKLTGIFLPLPEYLHE